MENFDVSACESKIGYVFNDKTLLIKAFTHASYAHENGLDCRGLILSPITGGDGNKEYLAYFVKSSVIIPQIDDKMIKKITAL